MKAVILAAGLGSRLRDHHVLPKGFVRVHSEPIIVESLEILKQQGIDDILIVTGYGAWYYEQLAKETGLFEILENQHYEKYASLYSLYCARDWVDDDCLLLESDLVYEARAVNALMNAPAQNAILVSGATQSTDEVYVEASNHCLTNMSKRKEVLIESSIVGEFVGINKLSLLAYQRLMCLLDNNRGLLELGHYEEDGLVALSKVTPLTCVTVPDLLWCEIDTGFHLERAKQLYSSIRAQPVVREYAQ